MHRRYEFDVQYSTHSIIRFRPVVQVKEVGLDRWTGSSSALNYHYQTPVLAHSRIEKVYAQDPGIVSSHQAPFDRDQGQIVRADQVVLDGTEIVASDQMEVVVVGDLALIDSMGWSLGSSSGWDWMDQSRIGIDDVGAGVVVVGDVGDDVAGADVDVDTDVLEDEDVGASSKSSDQPSQPVNPHLVLGEGVDPKPESRPILKSSVQVKEVVRAVVDERDYVQIEIPVAVAVAFAFGFEVHFVDAVKEVGYDW
jgi:hypothetical protein